MIKPFQIQDHKLNVGPAFPVNGTSGIMVDLMDIEEGTWMQRIGCHPNSWVAKNMPASSEWIALVQRRKECTFIDQIVAMKKSGATALILGNRNIREEEQEQRGRLNRIAFIDRNAQIHSLIPSTLVTKKEFLFLQEEAGTTVTIEADEQLNNKDLVKLTIMLLMILACIVAILSNAESLDGYDESGSRRLNGNDPDGQDDDSDGELDSDNDDDDDVEGQQHQQQQPRNTGWREFLYGNPPSRREIRHQRRQWGWKPSSQRPAKQRHLDSIPLLSLDMMSQEERDGCCAICIEDFSGSPAVSNATNTVSSSATIRRLPCNHLFHTSCIDPWLLNRRRTCPCCKGNVVKLTKLSSGNTSNAVIINVASAAQHHQPQQPYSNKRMEGGSPLANEINFGDGGNESDEDDVIVDLRAATPNVQAPLLQEEV